MCRIVFYFIIPIIFFFKLGAAAEWLNDSPEVWNSAKEYKDLETKMQKLTVVNDPAERVIKDIQDYFNLTSDKDYREDIIRISQKRCKEFKKCREDDLNKL